MARRGRSAGAQLIAFLITATVMIAIVKWPLNTIAILSAQNSARNTRR